MPPVLIYKSVKTGLANRLRALVGYQALSYFMNLPFRLCWSPNDECQATFEALFEVPLERIGVEELNDSQADWLVYERTIWFDEIWSELAQDLVDRDAFVARVRGNLNGLAPCREIRDRVAAFRAEHDLSNAIGVHIRHTDNLADYQRHAWRSPVFDMRRISMMEGYVRAMDAHVNRGPIFLATDDPEVERRCAQRYGNNLVTYPKRYINGELRTSSVCEALVDMILLGTCQSIVGTYFSSFSKFSAIWSGTAFREVVGNACERNKFVDELLTTMPAATLWAETDPKRETAIRTEEVKGVHR